MSAELLRFDNAISMPWLNGGGNTHEIARALGSDGASDFDWRLSVADVADSGAFSSLPGIDRILVLCEGPRMVLQSGGSSHELVRWEPFAFAGEYAVSCEVPEGPTRDFNVMTRRDACHARARLVRILGEPLTFRREAGEVLLVVLDGAIAASLPAGKVPVDLGRFDTIRLSDGDSASVSGDGRLLAIEVVRKP